MSEIAVINRAPGVDDRDVAFWAEACNQQAREIAGAHGVQYTPVVFYGKAEGLPFDCRIMTIRASIDAPGAIGFHTDDLGTIFAEVKATDQTSITMSHEEAEEIGDPAVNLWDPFDADHEQAHELSDRVEGDSYEQEATVLGETRKILVSNYLLPSAFDPSGAPPYDRMGRLKTWNGMTPGGYVIVRNISTGKVGDVFADARYYDDHLVGGRAQQPPPAPRHLPYVIPGPDAGSVLRDKLGKRRSRLVLRLRG